MAFLSMLGSRKKSLLAVVTATATACLLALAPLSANAEGESDAPPAESEVVTTEETPAEVEAPADEVKPAEGLTPSGGGTPTEEEETSTKVFVCKYTGQPGVDEVLQTGQNPISVSTNSIQSWDGTIPSYFSDAQGRSYVIALDTGQAEPTCPDGDDGDDGDSTVAPTASAQIVCVGDDPSLEVTGQSGSEEVDFTVEINGVEVDSETVVANGDYSYEDDLEGFSDGGYLEVGVYANGDEEPIFGAPFTIDCADTPPVVTPPTASAQIVCVGDDPSLEVTGQAGSEETEFQTQIFGVTVDTETVAPVGSYSYTDPISEFQNGDSFTVTVLGNGAELFDDEFTIDCADVPPITPSVCTSADTLPTSTNLNPRGWVLGGAAEYVDGGIKFSSDNWVDAYVTHATNFELKDARNMFMDLDVADTSGNYGFAVILETSLGNIHSEDYYSDELWTNSPGLLPVTGGGQGGPYSGSLEDALVIGNPTVTSVTFLFTSSSPNSAILSEGGYNCLIQPFDFEKELTPPTNPPETPPSTTGLPNTGSGNPLPFVGTGVLLLLAGLAFVLVQQRRRAKANTAAE